MLDGGKYVGIGIGDRNEDYIANNDSKWNQVRNVPPQPRVSPVAYNVIGQAHNAQLSLQSQWNREYLSNVNNLVKTIFWKVIVGVKIQLQMLTKVVDKPFCDLSVPRLHVSMICDHEISIDTISTTIAGYLNWFVHTAHARYNVTNNTQWS